MVVAVASLRKKEAQKGRPDDHREADPSLCLSRRRVRYSMLTFSNARIKTKEGREKITATYEGHFLFPGDFVETDRGVYIVYSSGLGDRTVELRGVPMNDDEIIAGILRARNGVFNLIYS